MPLPLAPVGRSLRRLLSTTLALALVALLGLSSAPVAEAAGSGSRSNPYWVGTTFSTGDWRIKAGVTDTDVWDQVRDENMFNDPPKSGHRFVMAPFTVTYKGSGSEQPWLSVDTDFLGGNKRIYTTYGNSCGVIPNSLNDVDDLYEGGRATGNRCVEVPASAIKGGLWRVNTGGSDKFVRLANPAKPSITKQPTNAAVWADSSVKFSAAVKGASKLRWQVKVGTKWSDIKGATKAAYSVKARPSYNKRSYRLKATNKQGTVYSRAAALTVKTKPEFATQPSSSTVYAKGTAAFSASTRGATAWGWQTQTGGRWVAIEGATARTLKVSATTSLNGRKYRLVAKAKYASTASRAVMLTVIGTPTITAQPRPTQVATGSSVTLSVTARDARSYQWQSSPHGAGAWTDVAGASSRAHTFVAEEPADYRVVVSNPAGRTISAVVGVTLLQEPETSPFAPGDLIQLRDKRLSFGTTDLDASAARQAAGSQAAPEPGTRFVQVEVTTENTGEADIVEGPDELWFRSSEQISSWNTDAEQCGPRLDSDAASRTLVPGETSTATYCVAAPEPDLENGFWVVDRELQVATR